MAHTYSVCCDIVRTTGEINTASSYVGMNIEQVNLVPAETKRRKLKKKDS